jgi:opacity protein-like surface antigen
MKTKFQYPIALTICIIVLLSLLPAQSQVKGRGYFDGDIGGSIMPDADFEEYFGNPIASGSEVEFDPGFRMGLRAGYGVTDWFAAELETGLMVNSIDSISGATESDAFMSNIPCLVNARFQLSQFDRLTPYFGVGVGFSVTTLDADNIAFGGGWLEGTMSTVEFAYQGFAGLRYNFNDNMGVSLEYRYFATTEPEWEADVIYGPAGSDSIGFGRIQSHVFSIAFQFRF